MGSREAYDHAIELMRWQSSLGINHEQTLHHWALEIRPLIIASNYLYGSLHFVVTTGVLVFLFRKHSDDYPLWRNTIAIATGHRADRLRVLAAHATAAAARTTSGSSTRSTSTRRSGRSSGAR